MIQPQPYKIGLGSMEVKAKGFDHYSFLENPVQDQKSRQVAIDLGRLGLLTYIAFLFTLLRRGIASVLWVKIQKIKSLHLGFMAVLVQSTFACYTEEVLVILPISLAFCLISCALVKLNKTDNKRTHHRSSYFPGFPPPLVEINHVYSSKKKKQFTGLKTPLG